MKNLEEFKNSKIQFLLTDIDDTMTDHGQLGPQAYEALWDLHKAGIHVVPVTGRPAGWCELIARFWPVAGVVGENGGFYFRYHSGKMLRAYLVDEKKRLENRRQLDGPIKDEILKTVPGAALASDQFCRLMDLAIDYCEDVKPLGAAAAQKIKSTFEKHGAVAKISSIHVNGWFGDYDKLSTSLKFLTDQFKMDPEKAKEVVAFSGDSPNDEPMFAYFKNSFAVANVSNFVSQMKSLPQYKSQSSGGHGFKEIAKVLIKGRDPSLRSG